jgi:uncharacterized OB-fold protein
MDPITALAQHSPETKAFWDGLIEGRFLVRRCMACGEAHWYPRAVCPFCESTDTAWREGSGRGTIYSYSVMRRAKVPYAVAFVTLEEGPTMMTNLVDCDFDALRIGQLVKLAITRRDDGLAIPTFTPA